MTKKTHSLVIIIPAYNEEATIEQVIRGLHKSFKPTKLTYSIVVVDDNSNDASAKLARNAGAQVISHLYNTGCGGATATGLRYAKSQEFTIAATVDADSQHDPADVVRGVKLMIKYDNDLLIGSRMRNPNNMPKLKILGNRGLSLLTYGLFGVRVTDSQSGLRIFSRAAIETLGWKTNGYGFCSEMIWRAKQQKLSISEYPILAIYTPYSITKGQNNWNALNIIKSIIKWRVRELFGE